MAAPTPIGVYRPTRFVPLTDTAAPFIATDAVNGNIAPNDGATIIQITNTDASPRTLTVAIPGGVDGQAVTVRSYTLAAGVTEMTGIFPVDFYSNTFQFTSTNALLKIRLYSLI